MGSLPIVERFLEDKHTICAILNCWMAFISVAFVILGASNIPFFTFGPSTNTRLMGVVIDTWPKWTCVSMLTFLNTLVTEYVFDCFAPWIMTTVIDHKGAYIPYPKGTMMYFVIVSSTYRTLIQVVMIYVMLSQVDFLLVRIVADIAVTVLTTSHFLRNKVYDPGAYADESSIVFLQPSAQRAPAQHTGTHAKGAARDGDPQEPVGDQRSQSLSSLDAWLPT